MMSSLIRQLYHFDPHPSEKGVSDKPFKDKNKKSGSKNVDFYFGEEDKNDEESMKKARERQQLLEKKMGHKEVIDSMEKTLGIKNRAKFSHLTMGVLSMYACCRYFRSR